MFKYIFSIFKKTKERGLQWLYHRLILEFRIPQTFLGKKLKNINTSSYHFFSLLKRPFVVSVPKFFRADTLYVFYDLEVSPVTFNFCEALSAANEYRNKLKLKYLYVVFVPGPNEGLRQEMSDYEFIINKDARQWRKYNLLFSLTHLVPSCIGFSNCASRKEAELIQKQVLPNIYPKGYSIMFPCAFSFFEGARNSSPDIMAIRSTPKALHYVNQWLEPRARGRKIIVITLRQYAYMPQRNSNIEAWANFAQSLDPNHYFVVIVPDTEVAMNGPLTQLSMFEHFMETCWNIELRAALYESAYLNLGVNNGPFALCWLNKNCRYLMFKIITQEVPQTTEEAIKKHGLIPGRTPPFAMEYQKWVWEQDTEEVLNREFNVICEILEREKVRLVC